MSKEHPADDLWDMKFEELFAAPSAAAERDSEVAGPYVINLATSVEPISIPSTTLLDFEYLHVYQVTAWKNDRLLFRLRLGPIESELEATAILGEVQRDYPDASTTPAGEDDIRMIAAVAAAAAPRAPKAPADKTPPVAVKAAPASAPPVMRGPAPAAAPQAPLPSVAPPVVAAKPQQPNLAPTAPPARPSPAATPKATVAPAPQPAPTPTAATPNSGLAPAPAVAAPKPAAVPTPPVAPTRSAAALKPALLPAPPSPNVSARPAQSAVPVLQISAVAKRAPSRRPAALRMTPAASAPAMESRAPVPTLSKAPPPSVPLVLTLADEPRTAAPAARTQLTLPPESRQPAPVAAVSQPALSRAADFTLELELELEADFESTLPAVEAARLAEARAAVESLRSGPVAARNALPAAPPAAKPAAAPVIVVQESPRVAPAPPQIPPRVAPAPPPIPPRVAAPEPVRARTPENPRPLNPGFVPTAATKYARPAAPSAPMATRPASRALTPAPVAVAPPPVSNSVAPAAPAKRQFEVLPGALPSVDSTQTLRALTMPELDDRSTKLFVIQLALTEHEIAPDTVPNLAIFNEYRLYSTIGHEQGKVLHALRLGFFSDAAPAHAVAGYLGSFFEAPTVTRVSVAERERFSERRVAACKDSGDTGVHAAIELSSPREAPTTSLADLAARTRSGDPDKRWHGVRRS